MATHSSALAAARGWRILSGGRQLNSSEQVKRPKTGAAMSSSPSSPLLEPSNDRQLPPMLLNRLARLNDEQLAVIEVIAFGLERGK